MMECSCCGNERDRVVALQCHDEVKVCPDCIEWLRGRSGAVDVTPIMPVADMGEAIAFCSAAGFDVREYEPGGGYSFVSYDGQSVFDLDVDDRPGAYVIVDDVDRWHARLHGAGLSVTAIEDQPWGMREFTLNGPGATYLRIGRPA